jgi:uncharacterized membrane protein
MTCFIILAGTWVVTIIKQLETKRIEAFTDNLMNLQQQGRGVIFVVGQIHYQNLVKKLDEKYTLDEVKFFHPYTLNNLAKKHPDIHIGLEENGLTTFTDRAIRDNSDLLKFTHDFNKELRNITQNTY